MQHLPDPTHLQQLLDRQQIMDCLVRYCRGVDRFERDLLLSVYHPDAIDDHGVFVGGPEAFCDWAFDYHREHQNATHHMVFNHTLDLQGDVAHSEVHWLYFGDNRVKPNNLSVGRYLDRFERRDGRWAIAARVCVTEATNDLTPCEMPPQFLAALMSNGPSTRDRTDRSYERPLVTRQP